MNNDELEKIHKQLLDLEWRVKFLEMGMEDSVEFSKFVVNYKVKPTHHYNPKLTHPG